MASDEGIGAHDGGRVFIGFVVVIAVGGLTDDAVIANDGVLSDNHMVIEDRIVADPGVPADGDILSDGDVLPVEFHDAFQFPDLVSCPRNWLSSRPKGEIF
jgi:hypothetical protein